MLKGRIISFLFIMLFIISIKTSPVYAAGEQEGLSPSFGTEVINGVTNDVYGYWSSSDGKNYWGLGPGSQIEPMNGPELNANETGIGNSYEEIVKNVDGQRVHGSYMNNTNSCGSCHLTHTASGRNLLFKNTIWGACTSCHDGTLGMLNVFEDTDQAREGMADSNGYVINQYAFGGGSFAGPAGEGSSMHMATGILNVNAAPGGANSSVEPSIRDNTDPSSGSIWGSQFSCASCHSPHGSYSDRLLHYNPNGIGNETADLGGLKRVGLDVYGVNYSVEEVVYVVSKDDSIVGNYVDRDQNPWLYGYGYGSSKEYWTKIYVYNSSGEQVSPPEGETWNELFEVNYEDAYFVIPADSADLVPENATFKMDVAPAVVAKMTLGAENGYGISPVIDYGDETAINQFCAACHTDYIRPENGIFTDLYRHKLTVPVEVEMVKGKNGKITCLTCHFAHGTTAAIMINADNTLIPDANMDGELDYKDENNSSTLKRYVNNSACFKCHSEEFISSN